MITRRARASRVTLLATVPLLVVVTLASGCGSVSTPPSGGGSSAAPSASGHASAGGTTPTTAPSPVPTTTGGAVTPGMPACTGWPSQAKSEALPGSFIPVAVLRCVNGIQTVPGKGQWSTATLQRADTNLGELITALRQPEGHRSPGIMCPQIAMLPPQIVLIDSSGKMIIPRIPLSGCGLMQTQLLAALAKLSWHTESVRLVAQIQTPAEASTGCSAEFKDPFLMYGSPRPSAGGAVFTTRPAALRICIYSVSGSIVTHFVRGTTVTGATESALLAGLSGARKTSMCTLPQAQFAVVSGESPGAADVYVELGGCYRVLRADSGGGGTMGVSTGQATPQAVAIIQTVTHPKP